MLAVTLGDRHCSSPGNIRNVKCSLLCGISLERWGCPLCMELCEVPRKAQFSGVSALFPIPRRLFMSLSSFEAKGYLPCTSYSHLHLGRNRRIVPPTCTLQSEQKGNTTAYTCLPTNVRPRGSSSGELVSAPAGGISLKGHLQYRLFTGAPGVIKTWRSTESQAL